MKLNSQTYHIADCSTRIIDNEAIIKNKITGATIHLNKTATVIWNEISVLDETSYDELAKKIISVFLLGDISVIMVSNDVKEIIAKWIEIGLLVRG